ncbi:unnamed protein product [Spirodela intermedia]|uniref:Purple acid phosphatase n=1 Tax=Spirodela intermedia TaxID=51605 RepID=A0A7I8I819_SPIIN|nr:unnamed protein product [Spirodela intermedia]CAA6653729.1 unnamed protein product [Spirodela intermedia]
MGERGWPRGVPLGLVVLALLLNAAALCRGGVTSRFVRLQEKAVDMPLNADVFRIPPAIMLPSRYLHLSLSLSLSLSLLCDSLVHITQGDYEGRAIIVSWITPAQPGSSAAVGIVLRYMFHNYTSGFIHHCLLKDLEYDTQYFYMVGIGQSPRTFWFRTPPKSFDSNKTLAHYEANPKKGQTVLFVGDLSYADTYPNQDNVRWDTWGRFVERSTAYQPWIWTAGNHEIHFAPELVLRALSGLRSIAPFWYSIRRASAHIIVLASYSAYGKYTPQYKWLEEELPRVNRSETPWLIVLMHSPWYNSYNYHYMEGETMRVMFEPWFVKYKVDLVFAGHVHAYERSHRVSNIAYNIVNGKCTPVRDQSAPVYITIGDGGNLEGLATNMTEPQPGYSAFREASFGHAVLDIKNRTHAHYGWHRNQDGAAVEADSLWIYNRVWNPKPETD